jgi:hypothetical protein
VLRNNLEQRQWQGQEALNKSWALFIVTKEGRKHVIFVVPEGIS